MWSRSATVSPLASSWLREWNVFSRTDQGILSNGRQIHASTDCVQQAADEIDHTSPKPDPDLCRLLLSAQCISTLRISLLPKISSVQVIAPASTRRMEPVIALAAGLAGIIAVSTISCGSAERPNDVRLRWKSAADPSVGFDSVLTDPC